MTSSQNGHRPPHPRNKALSVAFPLDDMLTLVQRRTTAPTYKKTPVSGVYFPNGSDLGVASTNVFNLLQGSYYIVVTFDATDNYPVPLMQADRSPAVASAGERTRGCRRWKRSQLHTQTVF
jgi:hypothetical protein